MSSASETKLYEPRFDTRHVMVWVELSRTQVRQQRMLSQRPILRDERVSLWLRSDVIAQQVMKNKRRYEIGLEKLAFAASQVLLSRVLFTWVKAPLKWTPQDAGSC